MGSRASLRSEPCLRFDEFLPGPIAELLRAELLDGLEYERVELAELTRQWRAVRPIGDAYFGALVRKPGWQTLPEVRKVLRSFESAEFTRWLSGLAGEEIVFARPMTAYRMTRGDRICLHDDMSDRSHAVAVAYNLSVGWRSGWGGATVYGEVIDKQRLETPWDSPIELFEWRVGEASRFVPRFNSLLVMRLDHGHAHGVEEVTGDEPRLSLVGIYARAGTGGADGCRSD